MTTPEAILLILACIVAWALLMCHALRQLREVKQIRCEAEAAREALRRCRLYDPDKPCRGGETERRKPRGVRNK
jgi:hypothetical protein